jgi:hypothetical protein
MLQLLTKMESHHAKWKVEVQKWCSLSSIFRRWHAKLEVLSPQCRLMLQNAEQWQNTTQTLLFVSLCFSAFLALIVSPVFFLLGFAKLYGLLGFTNSNYNSNSNININNKKLLLQQPL